MFIIGHKLLKNSDFSFITKREEIKEKKIYCMVYDEKLIAYLKDCHFEFAILVQNKDEIFLGNALGAKFLIFEDIKLAKFASEVAEFYIFDSRILMLVNSLENFEQFYKLKLDGVILKNIISNFSEFKNK
ncbi:hypothetical protein LNU06_05055 [Campylobacter sp. VicNov18]|uniref:hypothetical protein n=1 Tax=Campylobacter bilis TaxID=2691918 RepID=UPI00130E2071|nr:hypothetical protein [Campylobacter bilis]MPV63883.1 hypothetical protein [Campylobacter hepaticus]MBM0637384.1 hypothetical protein [Campylobacter bilis]MCC8278105.1 hypothetical protein [Campylobacter bilis]MCC8299609.1 hypothetical protein [Campylobacter bilis]MCC8301014.1 hypothetical protein [Campylobacter bilis]